jgi:hypothetical protein
MDQFRGRSGGGSCIEGFHKIQNHVKDCLSADRGIDHGVVDGAVGLFDVEILLDEIDAFPIDRIHELFGLLPTLPASQQAPHFIFSRSVKEHPQRVLAIREKLLRPSSDDDRVPRLCRLLNHTFRKLHNAFAVNQLELVRIEAPFITPAQERFEEPIIQGIGFFLSTLDNRFGTVSKPRNLLGQQLIPELPAELLRKQLSDFAAAASVLPFNGDDFYHVEIPEF